METTGHRLARTDMKEPELLSVLDSPACSLLLLFLIMQSGILFIKITMYIKNMILLCQVIKKK